MVDSMKLSYSVVLDPAEEGRFTVRVPRLPGCVTEGDTAAEALANAREAIEVCLESLEATGEALPEAAVPVEVETIRVSRPAA